MISSTTRAAPLKEAAARATRPARRPLHLRPVAMASASAKTQQQQRQQQRTCLSHLERVALPRARLQRLAPYADADAELAVLVSDPLLIEATSGGSGNGSSKKGAQERTRAAVAAVDAAVDSALQRAFGQEGDEDDDDDDQDHALLFLQRCLYRLNRLTYVFYDGAPLDATYGNERAPWLLALRDRIEAHWQPWELEEMAAQDAGADALLARYQSLDAPAVERELLSRLERDRYRPSAPTSPSPDLAALRDRLNPKGYAHLLAAGAHDGLTEASRQSRVCAGAGHPAASACFRILSDEYGGGKLERKHSTFYAQAMKACGVLLPDDDDDNSPSSSLSPAERWIDLAPWQSLAATNHNFLLAERRRHFLRYCGALAAFELAGPRAYEAYASAADRLEVALGGSEEEGALGGYWRLHVREDARHGPQALKEVALPLVALWGDAFAWEALLGYDQENFLAARATAAVRRDVEEWGGFD
jgi:hypothetical protein